MFSGELSRRRFLTTTAAVSVAVSAKAVMAQDPDVIASPEATPARSLPTIPPEFDVETNWPVEGYDLAATRNVQGSDISSETIDTLGDARKHRVDTSAPYGHRPQLWMELCSSKMP